MNDDHLGSQQSRLAQRIRTAQVAAHYEHVPAMIVAPCLGGAFSVWVLAGAVDDRIMYLGFACLLLLSATRYVAFRRFMTAGLAARERRIWGFAAIVFSGFSGVLWGSAAIFLYPPFDPAYQIYMVLIFALIPLAPIAALACYLPTFYAYYIPCALPFLVRLTMQQDRAGLASAALLLMLMAAAVTFARRYYLNFFEALRLRLIVEQQRDELEAANRSKSAFLAAASHDLRQPMHAIALFAEALQDDVSAERGRSNQRGLVEASHALRSLLDRLLDLSQLDSGGLAAHNARFKLDDLLQRLDREFAPQARQRGLTLKSVRTGRSIVSDPDLVEDLLRNLLSNAVRYTRSGGVIVGARIRGECTAVQVSDTGIGLEPRYLERIFDEFFQIDNPERDRSKGLGLGLSVVRRIVRLLDARMTVVSTPGRGTTFTVIFPATDAIATDAPSTDEASERGAVVRSAVLQGKRILLVENDGNIREGFAALATTWGADVLAAESASAALEAIDSYLSQSARPDVMIVDHALPQPGNGISLAQEIEQRFACRIPTIIVTGDMSDGLKQRVSAAGYTLARKPLRFGNLKALIVHELRAGAAASEFTSRI